MMSTSETHLKWRRIAHCWQIGSFSTQVDLLERGSYVDEFGDGDYAFRLQLFPNGKDDSFEDYVSLFLNVNKCPVERMACRVRLGLCTPTGVVDSALSRNVIRISSSGVITASKFFQLSRIQSRPAAFLVDDRLRVLCELTIFEATGSAPLEDVSFLEYMTARWSVAAASAAGAGYEGREREVGGNWKIYHLVDSGRYSDFHVLSQDGHSFKCHRVILIARSPYFEGMLAMGGRESTESTVTDDCVKWEKELQVTLHYMWTTVRALLRWMYGEDDLFEGDAPNRHRYQLVDCKEEREPQPQQATVLSTESDQERSLRRYVDLLGAADEYCMDDLKAIVERHLDAQLAVNNPQVLCQLLHFSKLHSAPRLYARALALFVAHRDTVVATKDYQDLSEQYPTNWVHILDDAHRLSFKSASSEQRAV